MPPTSPRPTHFDLMIEGESVLWTWELPALPDANSELRTRRLFDHRLDYLDYEGPVSGNRGHVKRIDRGAVEYASVLDDGDQEFQAVLTGTLISGRITLVRESSCQWQLHYQPSTNRNKA